MHRCIYTFSHGNSIKCCGNIATKNFQYCLYHLKQKIFNNFNPKLNDINDDDILIKQEIYNRKNMDEWLLKNHIDNGGDPEIYNKVMILCQKKGWIRGIK